MTRLVGDPLAFLTAHLGLFRPGIGEAFFFEPTPGFYGSIAQGSVQALTDALVILARHVECSSTPTVQEWKEPVSPLAVRDHDWAADTGPAGSIRYAGTHAGIIEIASTNKHSHFVLGATLAHELAHHYLAIKKVRLSDTDENERLTDLAAIYLGLGKLTLNGYEPQTWSVPRRNGQVTLYKYKIGYLSQEEIARAFIRVCKLRSLPLDGAPSNLSPTAARLLEEAQHQQATPAASTPAEAGSEARRRALWQPRWERARAAFLRVFPWRTRNRTERAQTQAARETLEEHRGGTLTDRLAEVVARGKGVGVTPEQMFKDFTGRGADQAVALAAIQRHFPAFPAVDWQTAVARETLKETEGRTLYPSDVLEFFAGRTIAPPPPYTLGGGTVTRPHSPNIIQRLRKDKIIQDFSQALRDLGKGGLTVQGGIFQPGALGQAHRQSGNVRLRYITDVDAAAHEFGHRLQGALGVRNADLQPFLGELANIQSATMATGPTIPEGWAEFWRLHATDPLQATRVAPQLYGWAEARLRTEPAIDAAWQAFRNQIIELRAQPPIERTRPAADRAETAETAPNGRTKAVTARLKASAQRWKVNTAAKVLGAVALLLALLFAGPIVYRGDTGKLSGGWYLIGPTLYGLTDQPFYRQAQLRAFETAVACEAYRFQGLNSKDEMDEYHDLYPNFEHTRCVAANDPRLASDAQKPPLGFQNLLDQERPGLPKAGGVIHYTPGRPIVVTVRLNGRSSARLVLDTGADGSMIRSGSLIAAGVDLARPVARGKIRGVAGETEVSYFTVDSMEVGEARVRDLRVAAYDIGESASDGLLGRDFLDGFNVSIDPAAGIIRLTPR